MATHRKGTKGDKSDKHLFTRGDPIEDGNKPVPESFDEITPEWCQWALRKGGVIGANTNVVSAEIERFKSKETGEVDDGGGLTDAKMIRIMLKYGGEVKGNEPESAVGKIMFECVNKAAIHWRILNKITGEWDLTSDEFWRTDIKFYRHVIPVIGEKFSYPKVYYTGITDNGDRNFFTGTIMNKPCRVKTVTLMEDMKGWESITLEDSIVVRNVEPSDAAECLKNIAVLHAAFWGDNNSEVKQMFKRPAFAEQNYRGAAHSGRTAKRRKKFVSSTTSMQNELKKFMKNWRDHTYVAFKGEKIKGLPEWFHPEPLEDGSLPVLKDKAVLEMFGVFASRYPAFAQSVADPFMKQPLQTIGHGDYHAGNHMYGTGENKGRIVAFDFQMVGMELVTLELTTYLMYAVSMNQIMDLAKIYHNALLENGVTDYAWDAFKRDFLIMNMEVAVNSLVKFSEFSPKQFDKILKVFGDKHGAGLKRILEGGIIGFPILLATDIYLKDKENFLLPETFDKNI